ncbi:MAG TPA: hypothetical protein VFJ58_20430, partial [Armatimonadota bacterium]|nr:hypothetical protein [Armatimonadota bacterium]
TDRCFPDVFYTDGRVEYFKRPEPEKAKYLSGWMELVKDELAAKPPRPGRSDQRRSRCGHRRGARTKDGGRRTEEKARVAGRGGSAGGCKGIVSPKGLPARKHEEALTVSRR